MALKAYGKNTIAENMANRTNFNIGNVRGTWVKHPISGHESGRLPDFLRSQLNGHLAEKDVYVVFSYQTPIAWAHDKEWFIPDVEYSNTTNNHQSVVRLAATHPELFPTKY